MWYNEIDKNHEREDIFMKKIRLISTCLLLSSAVLLQGCSSNDHGLDPDKPVTLTLWHYYSGSQKQAFDELVDEFNETQGKKQGINVDAVAKGSISNISTDLKSSLDKKVNAPELPNIFAAYGDTAEDMEKADKLVAINDYMSDEEMAEYVDDYMKDGSLYDHEYVNIFPIAKATEIMVINKNIWDDFAKKEQVSLSDLDTWEGLTSVSEKYYTYSGGKSFFGRDALMNYLNAGSEQLGTPLFTISGQKASFTVSKETMRKLWDQYYIPFVKGYYAKNGRFASDDMKTEDIIACVASSAGATFFPNEIVGSDGNSYNVNYIVRRVPNFAGKKSYAITQGAGMAISKSDETQEYASIQFLKWFTEKERNTLFSVQSSYLPVKKDANSFASWNTITKEEKITANQLVKDIVKTSMETVSESTLTSQKSFDGSYGIRNYLETALNEKCSADAAAVKKAVQNGTSHEQAVKPYLSDANFEKWFTQITKDINAKMKDSDA